MIKTIKWYIRGMKALVKSRRTTGYNAHRRWSRAQDGRRNGRHSERMKGDR